MLKSISKKNITYVGYTNNIYKRLILHNKGKGAKFTRGRKWKLIYMEKVDTKNKAISREYYIKNNRKLRNSIKNKFK
tara:strand:+ start:448 stop:678 length:231 start_codon:yes stop_codon:yes gene_type:complete